MFGEYRAPTGVSADTATAGATKDIRLMVAELGEKLGETPRLVVGKPGLDGHSNGAEQIALRARDAGMAVTYDGIRQTPDEIVARARDTAAHVIGLSILSGSHVPLVREVKARLRREGLDHIPVVVGGIISAEDDNVLAQHGRRRRLHPEGLRPRRHHGRHGAGGGAGGGAAERERAHLSPEGEVERRQPSG